MTKSSFDLMLDSLIENKVVEVLNRMGFTAEPKSEGIDDVIKGINALADFLGVCYATAYRLVEERGFPYRRFKRVYLFRKSEVLEYMAKKTNRH